MADLSLREVRYGLLGEFATPEALLSGLRALRAAGYAHLDAFTPFPVPEAEEVIELPPSPIPVWVFVLGLTGALFAYLFQFWIAAVDYPLNVGAMPAHSGPAFIPITFETMVLFASLTAFVSVLAFSKLPRLHHPLLESDALASASIDRFWVGVDGRDARFDKGAVTRLLLDAGALSVVATEAR